LSDTNHFVESAVIMYRLNVIFICFLASFFLTSCSESIEEGNNQTKILIEYALYDFPLPSNSKIQMENTVILGSGSSWTGRILLLTKLKPAELLKYFTENANASGWILTSSSISEQIFLVFNKEDRIATIKISKPKRNFLTSGKTKIEIVINHPNAVQNNSTSTDN